MDSIIEKTEIFVKQELANNDASHDWSHISRVRQIAKKIASHDFPGAIDLEVVDLGSLLHDVADWKYSKSETKGKEMAQKHLEGMNYDQEKLEKILKIIEGVSFKNELGGLPFDMFPELSVVQDADRLDALGAIGISRVFVYGGSKKRPLYLPEKDHGKKRRKLSKEEYMERDPKGDSSINHFYEKLLGLKDLMKTKKGHEIAEERHKFVENFLDQFIQEWKGEK